MPTVVNSIESEFRRYKALAEAAMSQLSEREMSDGPAGDGNSVATLAWHLGGNLASRFTDFLTTDGEKAWRYREEEFARRAPTRCELREHWERGWGALFGALGDLNENQLEATVSIRGVELTVPGALHRSLAHTSYHVGQIVYLARATKGADWEFLSIPPGGSEAYNANPTSERAESHASRLEPGPGRE